MQLSYDYAKDRALMCLRANYESHLCSSAGAVLRGTGLGLEYERPRRRRILRSVRGLACLLVSLLIISFTMSRRHDAGPNPYLEGSLRVHPIIFLSVCGFKIFFLPVDFRSNLPPRPRRTIRTSQPRMVEYGLISSRAMDHIPLPFLRLQRHDPQLRIGPSMPIILQMCAPKHATFV